MGKKRGGGIRIEAGTVHFVYKCKAKIGQSRGHQRKNHKRQVLALHQHYIMRLFSQTIVTRAYDSVVTPRD